VARAMLIVGLLVGCGAPIASEALADQVVDAPGADPSISYGDPMRAVNGVRGGGAMQGSTDVYSLNYTNRPYVTLRWSGRRVTNGPGADFVVFENAFRVNASADYYFMDPIVVAVSLDGQRWVELPHHYLAHDETMYSARIEDWIGFAGVTPVIVNDDTMPMSWLDPRAGGDAFDLDELASTGDAGEIRANGFRYVRLTSAAIVVNPDTGADYPHDGISNGADIDGVAARGLTDDR
jgi:hypothetical protein